MRTKIVNSSPFLLGLALIYAGLCYGLSWLVTQPKDYIQQNPGEGLYRFAEGSERLDTWLGIQSDPLQAFGLHYEDVSFPGADGSVLRGWLVPGRSRKTVLTVHDGGSDRRAFLRQLPFLHQLGYTVMLFDCREHGISDGEGRGTSFGVRESQDVLAAARYLNGLGIEQIAVFGMSQGAAAAIIAAGSNPELGPVILENPFTDIETLLAESGASRQGPQLPVWLSKPAASLTWWRSGGGDTPSPLQSAASLEQATLFMHSKDDRHVHASHSQRLYDKVRGPKELWLTDDARHSQLFNRDPRAYRERVSRFLERHFPVKI